MTCPCFHPGAGVPLCQHPAGQRLPPAGGSGGSRGAHRAEFRRAGGRDGAAIGSRPHPAATHHFLRRHGAAVQRAAEPSLCRAAGRLWYRQVCMCVQMHIRTFMFVSVFSPEVCRLSGSSVPEETTAEQLRHCREPLSTATCTTRRPHATTTPVS